MEIKYKVPKRTDGTFTCNVIPSSSIAEDMITVGNSTTDNTNVIVIPTIHPYMDGDYVRVQVSICQETSSSSEQGGLGFTIDNIGNYGGVKFWQRTSSYYAFSYGNTQSAVNINNMPYNTVFHIEIGNKYVKNLQTGAYLYDTTPTTLNDTSKNSNLWIGRHHSIGWIKVLKNDDTIIDHFVPKMIDGKACLVSEVNGAVYTANGTTIKQKDFVINNWKECKAIDFGGANVEFEGSISEYSANTTITSITNGTIVNTDGRSLFRQDKALKTFDLEMPNLVFGGESSSGTSNGMFKECSALTNLNQASFPNLQYATRMFQYCSEFTTFNTEVPKLTMGEAMFEHCSKLTSVTTNFPLLTNGTYMFNHTKVSQVEGNYPKLTTASCMFANATATTLNPINAPLLTNGYQMFSGSQYSNLSLTMPSLTNAESMFASAKIASVNLGDTSKLNKNKDMFNGCTALTSVDMSLNAITAWNNMFKNCSNIVNWNIKDLGIETSTLQKPKVASFDYIADNAKTVTNGEWFVMTDSQYANYPNAVTTLQGKGWNVYSESTYPKEEPQSTFKMLMGDGSATLGNITYNNQLEGIDKWFVLPESARTWKNINGIRSTNVYELYGDFDGITNMESAFRSNTINLRKMVGSMVNLNRAYYAFQSKTTLEEFVVDVPNLQYGNVMFQSCTNLRLFNGGQNMTKLIDVSDSNYGMFYGCTKLQKIVIGMPNLTYFMPNFIRNCTSLTDLFIYQLPLGEVRESNRYLNATYSPLSYNSFVYMAVRNEPTTAEITPILQLSTTSLNLSATTDVTRWWDTIIEKRYGISGYTSQSNPYPIYTATTTDIEVLSGDCGVWMSEEGATVTINAQSEGVNIYMVFTDKVVKFDTSELPNGTYSWYSTPVEGATEWNGVWYTYTTSAKYKVIIESDNQSALDAIVVSEDLDNNNTNLTI